MHTWQDRNALKQAAGVRGGGRDNTKPVLHFSLSWHETDRPDAAHMRETALGALKALGLEAHQALVIAHTDKDHPHVHLLVNTVHPETGRTASMKYSKEALSRWAEAYEKANGHEHCPERRDNNARRDDIKQERAAEKRAEAAAEKAARPKPARKKYQPVKDKSPNRRQWFEKKDVMARMKAMHATLSREQRQEKDDLWQGQQAAREALTTAATQRVAAVTAQQKEAFKPRWAGLYKNQKAELRHLNRQGAQHIFERAAYVFHNQHRLSATGKPLTLRQRLGLILSPKKLMKAVTMAHEREKRALVHEQTTQTKAMTDRVWTAHRADYHGLMERQTAERAAQRDHHQIERKEGVTFQKARDELQAERSTPGQFNEAARSEPKPEAQPPAKETRAERAERIRREAIEASHARGGRGGFEREREP